MDIELKVVLLPTARRCTAPPAAIIRSIDFAIASPSAVHRLCGMMLPAKHQYGRWPNRSPGFSRVRDDIVVSGPGTPSPCPLSRSREIPGSSARVGTERCGGSALESSGCSCTRADEEEQLVLDDRAAKPHRRNRGSLASLRSLCHWRRSAKSNSPREAVVTLDIEGAAAVRFVPLW